MPPKKRASSRYGGARIGGLSFTPKRDITNDDVINPATKAVSNEMVATPSRWLQLFDPPADAVYTIESAAQLTGVPRRTILVYCKHRLLSPLLDTGVGGYSFDGDGIRSLRHIEALRTVCGDDFAGIRIILDLTKELERLQAIARAT